MQVMARRDWLGSCALALCLGHVAWEVRRGGTTYPATTEAAALPDFAKLYATARPAVVTLLADRDQVSPDSLRVPGGFVPGRTAGAPSRPPGRRDRQGSGFLISPDGLIVTNLHVIAGAQVLRVALADGRVLPALALGRDPLTDLAVLRIQAGEPLPWLAFREGPPPNPGDPVLALGTPLGYEASASAGIVSGLARPYDAVDPNDFLQHDAAINPGSSGGPLLDRDGRVAGINTAIPDVTRLDIGIGLALPAGLVAAVAKELAQRGQVRRAWAGIEVQALDATLGQALGLAENQRGLIVTSVVAHSAGAAAGLTPGDLLLAAQGTALAHVRDLPRAVMRLAPGDLLVLKRQREQTSEEVQLRLGTAPPDTDDPGVENHATYPVVSETTPSELPPSGLPLGLRFTEAPVARGGTLAASGLVIEAVSPDGQAAAEGLRPGDVVMAIGRTPLIRQEQAVALLGAAREAAVAILVRRENERARYLVIEYNRSNSAHSFPTGSAMGGPY